MPEHDDEAHHDEAHHDEAHHDEAHHDEIAPEGNRVVGPTARAVLEYVVKSIVDDPEGVFIDVGEQGSAVTFQVHVSPDDMGRVIGKRGRVAQAIRQVVAAAAYRDGVTATVDFVD